MHDDFYSCCLITLYVLQLTHQSLNPPNTRPTPIHPVQVRFLHEPTKAHGFVGAALSSNVIHFTKDEADPGKWKTSVAIRQPWTKVCEGLRDTNEWHLNIGLHLYWVFNLNVYLE